MKYIKPQNVARLGFNWLAEKLNCEVLAFSLVELMISLITISLITAALAPVITKKLSAGTITVGSFGGGGSSQTTIIPKSQADCNSIGSQLIYVETDSTQKTGICVTQYNIGDGNFSIPVGSIDENIEAGAAKADGYCDDKKCCWHGATSGTDCTNINGSYSGCDRIVCNYAAAESICDNLSYGGYSNWRLPTKDEGDLFPQYASGNKDNGLMLCSKKESSQLSRCYVASKCFGGKKIESSYEGTQCYPYDVWLKKGDTNTYYLYLFDENDYKTSIDENAPYNPYFPFSVRCVIDSITIEESGGGGSSSVDINSLKKTMCGMFENKYWDNSSSSCKACSDDIPNCEKCSNGTTCEKCASGYQLVDGTCSATSCPRATMQIGDLCVTQYNIGDHDNYRLPNANSVDYLLGVYNAGSGDSACSADYTTGCCWKGATSGTNCDSANGSYSGCNRTVCNWYAADNLCKNISIEGFSGWRLPTIEELTSFNPNTYSKSNSPNPGDNGLMLCSYNTGNNLAYCSHGSCPGSYGGECMVNDVLSGTLDGSNNVYETYSDSNKVWGTNSYVRTYSFSVRCVIDMCKLNYQNCQTCTNEGCSLCNEGYYLVNGYCKKLTNVPNCLSYSSTEDKCTTCATGYVLENNQCTQNFSCSTQYDLLQITADLGYGTKTYCITQKNIGDSNYYRLPNPSNVDYLYGVYEAKTGDNACKANYTTGCCWQGNTTDGSCDSANGSYSGCNRTVCNWYAANGLCENLNILGQTGWRLPTQTELGNLNPATYSKAGTSYAGDNGLMFCDYYAGYNSARCYPANVCPGSYTGDCRIFDVWSGTPDGSFDSFSRYLERGAYNNSSSYRTNPRSVRCVKEL